jgi:hypothetical protein
MKVKLDCFIMQFKINIFPAEPDPNEVVTSKCGKLLEVCCRHPAQSTPPKCQPNNNGDIDETDYYDKTDNYDVFGTDDDIFGTDDDIFGSEDDIFGSDGEDEEDGNLEEDEEDFDVDIFGEGPATGTPGQCGKRNNEGVTRNLDESSVDEAKFGEWPHVCAVLKKEYIGDNVSMQPKHTWAQVQNVQDQPLMVYQCGASLIADRVVLTAGHCVNDTK